MSLDLSSIVSSAFTTVGSTLQDGTRSIVYRRITGNGTYDAVTGQVTSTVTAYTLKAVLTKFRLKEIDEVNIQKSDLKVLAAYTDLPFSPNGNDEIVIDSETWVIVSASVDPTGGALHTLQIRKAS